MEDEKERLKNVYEKIIKKKGWKKEEMKKK